MSTLSFGDKSRLIIKNIPNSLDNSSLDKLITKKCKDLGVTKCDIKLLTKEKKINKVLKRISRGICYVGFISEKDATKFLKHYNNSYFNSCKVSIEYSKSPGFIETKSEIQKPKDKESKIIENGKVIIEKQVTPRKAGVSSKQVHIRFDSDSDEDFVDHTKNGSDNKDNMGNKEKENKEKNNTKENSNRLEDINIRNGPNNDHSDKDDLLDMNRVVIFNLPYTVTEEMISNLVKPFGKIEQIHIPLNKLNYTDPSSVENNSTKGMCFVTFAFESDALKFIEEKNKSIFSGRIITISLAKAVEMNPAGTAGQLHYFNRTDKYYNKRRNDTSFNEFKMKKRKEESKNTDIWNILHVDIHSTIKTISSELEIESEEILKGEEAGVNLALSESYILNKLKNWFVEQGINYEINEYNEENLHEDILLIKNLPYNSDDKELIKLFSTYGQIIRFTTSPFKLLGLIQFNNKFECDKAFRNLSYRMYRGLPLYLQRVSKTLLPSSVNITENKEKLKEIQKIKENEEKDNTKEKEDINNKNKINEEENKETTEENTNEDTQDRIGHVSIYVSNIDPSVGEEELEKEFSNLKGFIIAKIIRPIKNDNNTGSVGTSTSSTGISIEKPRYGFIEFDSIQNAKEAIKKMCNTVIGGKLINLELSKNNKTISKHQRKKEEGPQEENDVIIVKNLPFQANKKELGDLFKYYANVKTVRIPKSAGNNHRGFGFVEFMSKNDAKTAMESLKNVHLYGRRLVLQYVENNK